MSQVLTLWISPYCNFLLEILSPKTRGLSESSNLSYNRLMKLILLFDADGVIINGKMFSKHLEDDLGIPLEVTSEFFSGVFNDCLEGKADLKNEIVPYLSKWGWNKGVDTFLAYWFKSEHVIDERLVELIQRLRAAGIKCYIATNQESHRTNYMKNQMNFNEWFDGIFSSADLGSKKPTESFYLNLLQKIDNPMPKDVWFFDDTQKNIDGAISAGLNAELYTSFETYNKFVEQQGWLVK